MGGKKIFDTNLDTVSEDILSYAHIDEFRNLTYANQDNNVYTNYVKRTLNYYISYEHCEGFIDKLMKKFFPDEEKLLSEFYLSKNEIKEMCEAGMMIGSHTLNHLVLSKLSSQEQEKEIVAYFNFIKSVGELDLRTFCYPYGGFHTFNHETECILEQNNCDFAFNVEARDIDCHDLSDRKQALPRSDCNMFPFGACYNIAAGNIG